MRGYAAWLARIIELGRVGESGLRLRLRNGMITSGEYRELARIAAGCARVCSCGCVRCEKRCAR